MNFINIEIKAKCFYPQEIEAFLLQHHAKFMGVDEQKDTYFNVPVGRLKLRQGNIENNLIFYNRPNQTTAKQSNFLLLPVTNGNAMEQILSASLGVKIIVQKKRKIFFINNIKFHIDEVKNLGNFVEIEAGNKNYPHLTIEQLQQQCNEYMQLLKIKTEDLVADSYSDLLLIN